jgi:hypothetical protein
MAAFPFRLTPQSSAKAHGRPVESEITGELLMLAPAFVAASTESAFAADVAAFFASTRSTSTHTQTRSTHARRGRTKEPPR